MNVESHVENLNTKHSEIERNITAEQHRPVPDTMRLMELKREKLRIKEEIRSFKSH
ncbi:DUF465 domain-containing protein [Temperatibacter marinus]|uniref:DUF465 domain-containing protein n=1 Tax=Temperatibacter marinus TaxID=1456591 RepID=A0AA52EE76_9PROT|nr:DUF465 domain-containing protein [Temperatibacter marinus]WND03090.1 DUF465 domain-containing protein [Temperatibacter marinus]